MSALGKSQDQLRFRTAIEAESSVTIMRDLEDKLLDLYEGRLTGGNMKLAKRQMKVAIMSARQRLLVIHGSITDSMYESPVVAGLTIQSLRQQRWGVCRLLLQYGASPDFKDRNDNTDSVIEHILLVVPLDLHTVNKLEEIFKYAIRNTRNDIWMPYLRVESADAQPDDDPVILTIAEFLCRQEETYPLMMTFFHGLRLRGGEDAERLSEHVTNVLFEAAKVLAGKQKQTTAEFAMDQLHLIDQIDAAFSETLHNVFSSPEIWGVNIDYQTPQYELSLLHYCALLGLKYCVRTLCELGANIFTRATRNPLRSSDKMRDSPTDALSGLPSWDQSLLNNQTFNRRNPLHAAFAREPIEFVGYTPAELWAWTYRWESVEKQNIMLNTMVSLGMLSPDESRPEVSDDDGRSEPRKTKILICAARGGNVNVVYLLMNFYRHYFDPLTVDALGKTALHWMMLWRDPLRSIRFRVNERGPWGDHHLLVVFAQFGLDPGWKDVYGRNAVHFLCVNRLKGAVDTANRISLLDIMQRVCGARGVDLMGRTPYHYLACSFPHAELLQGNLWEATVPIHNDDSGASHRAGNAMDESVSDSDNGTDNRIGYDPDSDPSRRGINAMNDRDNEGNSALHFLARGGMSDYPWANYDDGMRTQPTDELNETGRLARTCAFLVDRLQIPTNDLGMTPLHTAARYNCPGMVRALVIAVGMLVGPHVVELPNDDEAMFQVEQVMAESMNRIFVHGSMTVPQCASAFHFLYLRDHNGRNAAHHASEYENNYRVLQMLLEIEEQLRRRLRQVADANEEARVAERILETESYQNHDEWQRATEAVATRDLARQTLTNWPYLLMRQPDEHGVTPLRILLQNKFEAQINMVPMFPDYSEDDIVSTAAFWALQTRSIKGSPHMRNPGHGSRNRRGLPFNLRL